MSARRALWWLWLAALALGAESAAQWGAPGSWYQGLAVGTAVGLATWWRRP